jgi:hypothetical protein
MIEETPDSILWSMCPHSLIPKDAIKCVLHLEASCS